MISLLERSTKPIAVNSKEERSILIMRIVEQLFGDHILDTVYKILLI